jgi:hypothetical protein
VADVVVVATEDVDTEDVAAELGDGELLDALEDVGEAEVVASTLEATDVKAPDEGAAGVPPTLAHDVTESAARSTPAATLGPGRPVGRACCSRAVGRPCDMSSFCQPT